jgi:hypothetical protein
MSARNQKVDSRALEGTAIAEGAVLGLFLDRDRALVTEFLQRQSHESKEWRDALDLSTGDHWLTVHELQDVVQAMRDVLEPYRTRRRDDRPAGSRRVRVSCLTVPRADPDGSRQTSGHRDGKSREQLLERGPG